MTRLSRLQRLLLWARSVWKSPQPSPEEWLEEMTARLELELIELRRILAESIALQKSAERRQLRENHQVQGGLDWSQLEPKSLDTSVREQRESIEEIRQSLTRLEGQYAQVRGRKNWYLSRLKLALVQEQLASASARWGRTPASEVFAALEAVDGSSLWEAVNKTPPV
ncbi:MAG: hypothetical protein ACK5CA_09045 [Cyanobacteriota bacterium]|jgi:phage shock protein A